MVPSKCATFERILTDKGQTTGILRGEIEVELGREFRMTTRKKGGTIKWEVPTPSFDRSTWASFNFMGSNASDRELQLSPVSTEDSDVLQI
jgi:hypothetical protein